MSNMRIAEWIRLLLGEEYIRLGGTDGAENTGERGERRERRREHSTRGYLENQGEGKWGRRGSGYRFITPPYVEYRTVGSSRPEKIRFEGRRGRYFRIIEQAGVVKAKQCFTSSSSNARYGGNSLRVARL